MTNNFVVKLLRIFNYKSYLGRHSFDFNKPPGLYFISGSNLEEPSLGANNVGKSTLIDALYWCWTGETLRVKRSGSSIEPYNFDGTTKVVNLFEKNGIEHTIERSRKPNSLTLDGEVVDQPKINSLLGLSNEAIKRTLIVSQFGTLFLDLRQEEQSSFFTEVLDLDLWLKASNLANQLMGDADKDCRRLENILSGLKGQQKVIKDQYDIEKKLSEEFEIDKQDKLYSLRESLQECQQQLDTLQGIFLRLKINGNATSAIPVAETRSARFRPSLAVLQGDIRKAEISFQLSDRTRRELLVRLGQYQSVVDICPECKQSVTKEHIQKKRNEILSELDNITEESVQLLKEEVEELQEKEQELISKISKLDEEDRKSRIEWDRINREKQEIELKVVRAQTKVDSLKSEIQQVENSQNLSEKKSRDLASKFSSIKKEITNTEGEIKSAQYDVGVYKFWVNTYKEIRLFLIEKTLEELEIADNRHAESLGLSDWSIKFSTERQTVGGTISHKFSTFIYPPDSNEQIVWENIGGGVSTRWQLATTFGISEVLLSRAGIFPNIEILDEPSRHLSQQGIDDLLLHLSERARELGRAIYFVDHRSLDRGSFDGVIQIEKTKSGSRIVS